MKIAIVEDEAESVAVLESYLARYRREEKTEELVTTVFADGGEFLKNYKSDFDIIFMDIEMPGIDGMRAAKYLRTIDSGVCLVFVTNLAQYAVSGYEVSAFDFIVKPVVYGSFAMKLRRLFQYLATRRKCEICVSTKNGKILVKASDIKYVEIMRHVVTYHTESGNVVGSGTLKNVTELLAGLPFALCNRCYLVNLQYVTRIVGNEVCVGGDKLQIAAPRRKEFMNAFNEYLGAGGKVK